MNELYLELKDKHNYLDAYIIIKNMLSKNPGDPDLFTEFININLELAMFNIKFEQRKQYVNEANSALAIFSESADIDSSVLALIKEIQQKIITVFSNICNDESAYYSERHDKTRQENTILLNKLVQLSKQLEKASIQDEFDEILSKVAGIENQLNKEAFSDAQNLSYESLTQNYSTLISSKMESLNRNNLLSYNKRAVSCFHDVFSTFSKDKKKYEASESNLKNLMTIKFFVFDTSKLFNESLIYYNHVYTMIFQGVTDNLKYKLTEWAIKTPKTN